MLAAPAIAEIDAFRDLIARRLGLHFDKSKTDFLAGVLQQRMRDTGCRFFALYRQRFASFEEGVQEETALAQCLTVNETCFFRYPEQFQAFTAVALPRRIELRQGLRQLRILSAGCSSGEEAYSLAILLAENFAELAGWDVEIVGIDIDPAMIAKAAQAQYSSWSLRETSAELRAKYFRSAGNEYVLNSSMCTAVKFETRNLVADSPLFWQTEKFDAVFCRNVTMYFTPEIAREVIARITRCVAAGGFLFLGHAESLRGFSREYRLCQTHGTFYYQRTAATGVSEAPALPRAADRSLHAAEPERPWFDIIRQASDRVTHLTSPKASQPPGAVSSAAAGAGVAAPLASFALPQALPACDRAVAVELLRTERHQQALDLLRGLPADSIADADTQLLLAVLLANSGDAAGAEKVCHRVLALDEINAGAYYVMALCSERAGEREIAVEHDRAAAYLDPHFAMPHLHLGLLSKRVGDWPASRRELAHAQRLLKTEDPARILLFGGGFTRDALLELCREEIRVLGGRA